MNRFKVLIVAVAAMCLSSFAYAVDVKIQNVGGTFTNPGGGLQLSGATLTFVSGLGAPYDGSLSGDTTALSFSIGTPDMGSLATNFAQWTSGGGNLSFTDTTTGLVFSGSFTCSTSAPCRWFNAGGWLFSGAFAGTVNGQQFTGGTAQFAVGPGSANPFFGGNGSTPGSGGTSRGAITPVPEAGTLGMVGIGLLGIAGFTRRKFVVTSKFPNL